MEVILDQLSNIEDKQVFIFNSIFHHINKYPYDENYTIFNKILDLVDMSKYEHIYENHVSQNCISALIDFYYICDTSKYINLLLSKGFTIETTTALPGDLEYYKASGNIPIYNSVITALINAFNNVPCNSKTKDKLLAFEKSKRNIQKSDRSRKKNDKLLDKLRRNLYMTIDTNMLFSYRQSLTRIISDIERMYPDNIAFQMLLTTVIGCPLSNYISSNIQFCTVSISQLCI